MCLLEGSFWCELQPMFGAPRTRENTCVSARCPLFATHRGVLHMCVACFRLLLMRMLLLSTIRDFNRFGYNTLTTPQDAHVASLILLCRYYTCWCHSHPQDERVACVCTATLLTGSTVCFDDLRGQRHAPNPLTPPNTPCQGGK